MDSNEQIKQFGEALLNDAKKALDPYKATGKTADSIKIKFRDKGFTITGNASIGALIYGRKPTSSGASKSSPTLQRQILEWIKAKNITPRESSMSQQSLSWVISRHIHMNGYKGKGDIFAGVINQSRINAFSKSLLKNQSTIAMSEIIKQFKK